MPPTAPREPLRSAAPVEDPAPGVLPAAARHLRVPLPGRPSLAFSHLPGTGEPVLWLHPNRTSRRVFDHALAASRLGRPVFAPELRGHGDSDRPAGGASVTLDDHAGDLIAFVDALGLDRFALVGQATGATLGLFLATALGPRVSALALGNVALGIRPSVNALVQTQVAAQAGFADPAEARAATPFSHRWRPEVVAHWLAAALERREDGLWHWRWDPACVSATEAALVADRWDEIDVAAPVLLFRGAESGIILPEEIERARLRLPQARTAELPGADHRLSQDAPEGFAALVDGFLGRPGRRRGSADARS